MWRSLLATSAVIRDRQNYDQASGLRHTRAPQIDTKRPQGTAARSASMAKPTRHFSGDSLPIDQRSGEWSATHSRSTNRHQKASRHRRTEREYGGAYSPLQRRFATDRPTIRRVVCDTLALHKSAPKGLKAPPHGARVWRKPTRHFGGDSQPTDQRSGEWSATHSRSTNRHRRATRHRRTELEYGEAYSPLQR